MEKTDKVVQSPTAKKGKNAQGNEGQVVLGSFMNNRKKVEKIDLNTLNSIKDEENSCIELMKSVQHLSLHPFHLYNISNSIRQILDESVYRYTKSIGGILLNYQKLKIETPAGAISGDNCYIHIDIQGEFFKFLPDVGRTCFGYVTHIDETNISCIVHQIFHVSMTKPADAGDDWLGYQVEIGQKVLFRIMYVNLMSYMPHIMADLINVEDEICYDIEGAGVDTSYTNQSNKIVFDDDEDIEEPKETEDALNNSKLRKAKKIRAENLDSLIEFIEEGLEKKKKKKKIKQEDVSIVLDSEDEIQIKKEDLSFEMTNNNDSDLDISLKKKKSKKHRYSETDGIDVEYTSKKHKKLKSDS